MEMTRRQQMAMQAGNMQIGSETENKNAQIFKPREQVLSEKKINDEKEKTPEQKQIHIEEKKKNEIISDTEIPKFKR